MKPFIAVAVAFTALTSTALAQDDPDPQQPTHLPAAGLNLRQTSDLGCYSNPGDMWDMGPYTFQSTGWCQPLCVRQGASYFAVVNGTNCFCGNSAPKKSNKVSDDECNISCNGIDTDMCGGQNKWQIFSDNFRNGDVTGSIKITTPTQTWFGHQATGSSDSPDSDSNSDSTSSSKKAKPTDTDDSQPQQQSTVLVTISGKPVQTIASSESPTADSSSGSSPNKAGIAAGVVVGVVVLAAIVGGIIFFVRRKKQRELDDERRRHEAMTNFVTRGEKPPSTFSGSDSRLEPSVMFQRRQSDGSIADNQDYSRRILKVTNPDDR